MKFRMIFYDFGKIEFSFVQNFFLKIFKKRSEVRFLTRMDLKNVFFVSNLSIFQAEKSIFDARGPNLLLFFQKNKIFYFLGVLWPGALALGALCRGVRGGGSPPGEKRKKGCIKNGGLCGLLGLGEAPRTPSEPRAQVHICIVGPRKVGPKSHVWI